VCHVALNRPSYQVSDYKSYDVVFPANLANDGSHYSYMSESGTPRCAASQLERDPWWSVDLGLPLSVQEIIFTNRVAAREYVLECWITCKRLCLEKENVFGNMQ